MRKNVVRSLKNLGFEHKFFFSLTVKTIKKIQNP